jgi:predicted amidohydrolase
MNQTFALAVGQFSSGIGKIEDNLSAILRLSADAAKRGAKFILFPEDCLTGYPSKPGSASDVAIESDGAVAKKVSESAHHLGISIAAGFIERRRDRFHASHLVAFEDGSTRIIRKRSIDERDQRIGLTASDEANDAFHIGGAKTAMAICMDGTDEFFKAAAAQNVQILLHPSGGACAKIAGATSPHVKEIEAAEKENCRKCLEAAQKRAKQLHAVYCVANSVGFDGERGYPGNSWIISATGEVLGYLPGTAVLEKMSDGIAVATVELAV